MNIFDLGNSSAMNNFAEYFYNIGDYEKMKKYYKMSINKNNSYAMTGLGAFYYTIGDYEKMEFYYLMAIGQNNVISMNFLATYYYEITRDYKKMKKYYLMAIAQNDSDSMNNLGFYYYETGDYENMEKYYLMTIEKNNSKAMFNLGEYHYEITKNNDQMELYFKMAIGKNNVSAMNRLCEYYIINNLQIDFEILNAKIKKISETSKKYLESQFILFNSSNFIRNIYEKKVNEDFCKTDFEIITQNKTYNVHSFVLDSEYIVCLTSGSFKNKRNITIEVENEKTIDNLLEYLYLGKFQWKELEIEVIGELESFCDEYEFLNLLKNCKLAIFLKGLEF